VKSLLPLHSLARLTRRGVGSLAIALLLASCGDPPWPPSTPPTPAPLIPPVGSFTIDPQGPVLLATTRVTLTATGTAADGGAVTYKWGFGDAYDAVGQTITHVFQTEGRLPVILTIRDSKGSQTQVATSIVVRSVSGRWVNQNPNRAYVWDIEQVGSVISGTVSGLALGEEGRIENAALGDPRTVTCHVYVPCKTGVGGLCPDVGWLPTEDYRGSLDVSLNAMSLVSTNGEEAFDLTRQP
jgi:PKD repeat protein